MVSQLPGFDFQSLGKAAVVFRAHDVERLTSFTSETALGGGEELWDGAVCFGFCWVFLRFFAGFFGVFCWFFEVFVVFFGSW